MKKDPAALVVSFLDRQDKETPKQSESDVSEEEDALAQEILDSKDSRSLAQALKAFMQQCMSEDSEQES